MTKVTLIWQAKRRTCLIFGAILLIGWLLSGCNGGFANTPKEVINNAQSLPTPRGQYLGVAWLNENQIAFTYKPEEFVNRGLWLYQIALYNIDTQEWQVLTLPKPDEWPLLTALEPNECVSGWVQNLARLPNGKLGFTYQCNFELGGRTPSMSTLYMWDQQTGSLQALHRYPENFSLSRYAFAPDMAELIQERPVGSGLNNELYRVSEDGQLEHLFPDYQRVRSPSWSPDGQTIAFVGTEIYPGDKSAKYIFIDLLPYPWDLYLMDADGGNVRIILAGIRGATTKWLPQGRYLSFSGIYEGERDSRFRRRESGVWILDTETLEVTRIHSQATGAYDWSPDGRQMVIIVEEEKEGVRSFEQLSHPVIVDVPLLEE